MNRRTFIPHRITKVVITAITAAIVTAGAAGCGSSVSTGSSGSTLEVGELMQLTGNIGEFVKAALTGADAAIKDINANGGVLGHKMSAVPQDTAGDVADAITAWHALQLSHPTFELGPLTVDSPAVIKLYDSANLPDFNLSGSPQYDNITYKYVFRAEPSDSVQGIAMAAYALHLGKRRAAYIMTNDAAGQSLMVALKRVFTGHGGTIVYNGTVAPGLPSYYSDLQKIFAQRPDVIFLHADDTTAGTLLSDMRALGDAHTLMIGDNSGTDPGFERALGAATAAKYLVAVQGASSSPAATSKFDSIYQKYEGKAAPSHANIFYDAVNIAALAMIAANSVDPRRWVTDVTTVADPPGVPCYDFVDCRALLVQHKKINYQGASNSFDFNGYHNIFGDWAIQSWQLNGTTTQTYLEKESLLASL